jgi:hypothetical protein
LASSSRFSRLPFLVALALPLGACSEPAAPSADATSPAADESDLKAAKPLSAQSFGKPLTKAALRASNDNLPDDLFETKWQASLATSPVMFARAYPGAFHADLAQVDAKSLPGGETLCFGDAHPDNFGFLRLGDATRFLYNDLDDSGFAKASVDALRYFAIVRLYFGDEKLTADLVEAYVDGLKDAARRESIAPSLAPSWADVRKKGLDKVVSNDRFVPGGKDGLAVASGDIAKAVRQAIASVPALAKAEVLDVATLDRSSGGSGGLARYWALLNPSPGTNGAKKTIYELKEMATPGTERGRSSETLEPATRLAELKLTLWDTDTDSDYLETKLLGRRFLLRDRLAKKSVDLAELSKSERTRVLATQAGLLAARHALSLEGVKKDDLRPWLLESSRVVAERWDTFYRASVAAEAGR